MTAKLSEVIHVSGMSATMTQRRQRTTRVLVARVFHQAAERIQTCFPPHCRLAGTQHGYTGWKQEQ